jgi:hypothetical protein
LFARNLIGFANSFGATCPTGRFAFHHAKRNRANRSLLSGKRFLPQRTAVEPASEAAQPIRGHASKTDLKRKSRETE